MNTSYVFPLFWTLIAEVVLDSISVLARNCSRLARNLALPCEKVGVESWSQARIAAPGCDISNFTLVRGTIVRGSLWQGKERTIAGHLSDRIRVYPPSGTLPVGELVPGKKQARHSLGCNSKG